MTRTECDNMFHDNMYAMCEVESRTDAEQEACQVHYLHINEPYSSLANFSVYC